MNTVQRLFRIHAALYALIIPLTLARCGMFFGGDDDPAPDAPGVTGLSFQNARLTVPVQGSDYLRLTVAPSALQTSASVTWEYDSEKVSVNPDTYGAVITGVSEGETYVKAKANGLSATCLITVQGFAAEYAQPPYIYSSFGVVELTPGSSETVSVSLYGGQSYDLENFTWEIADPTIASIAASRNNCVVQAIRTGSTQITASHPDCAYTYTMVVYVYTDTLAECYLTTSENVVSVNTDESSRTVSVSVQNPYTPIRQSGFSWSFIDETGAVSASSSILSLSPNGETVLLTPLSTGLQKIRAAYDECDYPLDILIRVTSTVENVYIEPSTTTLTVIGSNETYNVYADIEGYSGTADPDAFVWSVLTEDADELMEWTAAGNTLSVKGKKNGTAKVKVTHPLSETSRTILVIMQEQAESAVDAAMYITTSGNYIQTKVGAEAVEAQVSLVGGQPGDEADFEWKIADGENNDIVRINTPTGKISSRAAGSYAYGRLIIAPLKAGTVTISVTHPKILYSTDILVRVYSEYAQLTAPVYLSTDATVVKILNGSTYELAATLSGNTANGDENGIRWASANSAVISVSPASGNTTVLTAHGIGAHQTYITASHDKVQAEKRVLVLSADTQAELDTMKSIYADKTYYRLNEGASDTLTLNQYGLSGADIAAITWTVDKPHIATVEAAGGNRLTATIKGVASGTAVVTASFAGCTPCAFNVTVLPAGEKIDVIDPPYLTTAKNAVTLEKAGDTAAVAVTGVSVSAESMAARTEWRIENAAVASVTANGASASITALKAGRTRITVSNPDASNSLSIDVTVGETLIWNDPAIVYIVSSSDVVPLVKGGSRTIGASLVNSTQTGGFSFEVTGKDIIDIAGTYSGTCLIEAKEAGTSEITVKNAAASEDKQILVIVANSEDELRGITYLTTTQNVVTVGEGLNTSVTVSVANAASPVLSGYSWVSSNSAVIEVVSSGQTAVFYGRRAGTAKVTVSNPACPYPLEIIANCVDPVAAAASPYITAPNIVTLTAGAADTTVTASLAGGTDADKASFSWFCDDATVVRLYANNDTAQLRALKEGAAQITVRHPKAGGVDRTILVICEPAQTSDYYITTSDSIISLSPSDSAKTITATLVNGSAADNYNFKWWADDYSIIDMNYTSNQAVITPIAAGSVTIHVSHPKALYQKDIIVNISQYSEFAFEQTSISLTTGTQAFVNMHVPSSSVKTRVSYTVKKADGSGAASDIVGASGTDSVCVLDPRGAGSALVEASLVAVNSGVTQATAQLLVSVSEAQTSLPYISFVGSTIITLEKGVTKTLSASLSGNGAVAADSDSLQWRSSDQSVLQIAPASASGAAVRKEVQVTALKAGAEATITISHEKAATNISLYFIVPGENSAHITLSQNHIAFEEGDSPSNVTATITNAAEKDYENLVWTLTNANEANPAASLSGSGKTISVRPLTAGEAVLTARVPSSGKTAECTIQVEKKKSITLSTSGITIYPSGLATVTYTVSPASEAASLMWTIGDSSYATFADNKNGTLTVIGKDKEGSTYLEAISPSGVKSRFTVNNKWGNIFTLNKTALSGLPENTGGGVYDITYNVSPACAEIHVYTNSSSLRVLNGTRIHDGYYVLYAANHADGVNVSTGVATGTIRLSPNGETKNALNIIAYNPQKTKLQDGSFEGADIAAKTVTANIGYNSYSFDPRVIAGTTTGKYSRYDTSLKAFVLGDGESFAFSLPVREPLAQPASVSVTFQPNNFADPAETAKDNQNTDDVQRFPQRQYINAYATGISNGAFALQNSGGSYALYHTRDYGADGVFFGVDASVVAVENGNTTVRASPFVGVVRISYTTGTGKTGAFEIPVYVEVRNCTKNY